MKKNYLISILFVLLFCISMGYAYLNSSLYINGTSIINANIWEVGLDNLDITVGSVVAIQEPIVNDNTTAFTVKLANKEDFYEFTVDVVNSGEYDAKLGSLIETTGLTSEQEQYFDYTITYQNDEPIKVNQIVKKEEFVRLKSKVEYKEDVNIVFVPENAKTLNLGFKVNYDLDDGTGVSVKDNGVEKVIPVADNSLNNIGTVVTIGTEKFYVIGTEGENVKLLSMYNLHVGNSVDENYNATPLEKTTGMQDSNAKGYIINFSTGEGIFPFIGTTAFSSSSQKGENYSDYNGSIIEGYVNNYKKLLENKYGVDIKEARLISMNELTSSEIGCNSLYCIIGNYWIYSTSYWILDTYSNEKNYGLDVKGAIYNYQYSDNNHLGVRPVIVIPKSNIVENENN